jgi:hypothetical protein
MDNIYWSTEESLPDNTCTMAHYLENVNMLDIILVDGSYAEGSNCQGEKYEIHVCGNGNFNDHMATFKLIND